MAQSTMYPAMAGSPKTALSSTLASDATTAYVDNLEKLPAAPNVVTFWIVEETWERCVYSAKSAETGPGTITIARSGAGHASSAGNSGLEWAAGTKVARNPGELDHTLFKANIEDLATRLGTAETDIDGKQPADATLTALAGVTTAENKLIYSTSADTFSTCDLTEAARSVLDDSTISDMRTTLAAASSTTAAQSIYVDKAATGTGDGTSWINAFTTIQAAINSLPAIISHAVVIYIRKGATPYAENLTFKRVIGTGSVTIRGEYFWYGTVATGGTGSFTISPSDPYYADRANISVGDRVVVVKWSGTVGSSVPSETWVDSVASVSDAVISLTTNTGAVITTNCTYVINHTETSGTITVQSNLTMNGISNYNPSSYSLYGSTGAGIVVNYCYLKGTCGYSGEIKSNIHCNYTYFESTAAGDNAIVVRDGVATIWNGCIVAATITGNCILSLGQGNVTCGYIHLKSGAVGLNCIWNSFISNSGYCLNSCTVFKNPATSSDASCIL